MPLRIQLRRWHLGLHGLALLRDWPFGDPVDAEARIGAMRDLLEGRGEPSLSFQGQASASVPTPLRSSGQDLDVALHLTINLARPRPRRSDSKVVEMVSAAM